MTQCAYNYFEYTAQSGDTYASLSEKFGVSEKALVKMNGDSPVKCGRRLNIPSQTGGCACGIFYAIKKGDTLYRIAKRRNVSIEELLAANPFLNPAYYVPGQVIVLPAVSNKPGPERYTLGQKERLRDVLIKFDMDITAFCEINPGADPMHLKEGQTVYVSKGKKQKMD